MNGKCSDWIVQRFSSEGIFDPPLIFLFLEDFSEVAVTHVMMASTGFAKDGFKDLDLSAMTIKISKRAEAKSGPVQAYHQ